mgnify:CR=1 FL=1
MSVAAGGTLGQVVDGAHHRHRFAVGDARELCEVAGDHVLDARRLAAHAHLVLAGLGVAPAVFAAVIGVGGDQHTTVMDVHQPSIADELHVLTGEPHPGLVMHAGEADQSLL